MKPFIPSCAIAKKSYLSGFECPHLGIPIPFGFIVGAAPSLGHDASWELPVFGGGIPGYDVPGAYSFPSRLDPSPCVRTEGVIWGLSGEPEYPYTSPATLLRGMPWGMIGCGLTPTAYHN